MKKFLTFLMIGSFIIAGCKNGCTKKDNQQAENDSSQVNLGELPDTAGTVHPDSVQVSLNKDSVLTHLTGQVLTLFKNRDYTKLDSFIHPTEGIRFSPYATVDLSNDKQFSREAFHKLITSGKGQKLNWGSYDGSGDPIFLSPDEYFRKFVYDANFVNPSKFDINNFISRGNSSNNLKKIYEGSDFTESYSSGSKKNGNIDWKAVRLVFKKVDGKYYLVGIVHDQWTI